MPFITSVPCSCAGVRRPAPSTVAVTRPLAGLMRTICVVGQTLAHTCPPTHSSSFSWGTGLPSRVTVRAPVWANVVGLRKRRVAEPSLWTRRLPS